MISELIPGETPVLHLGEMGLSITTKRVLHRESDSAQKSCFLEDVALMEVSKSESKGCLNSAAFILLCAAAAFLASLPAERWLARDLRGGAVIGALVGALLLLIWFVTRQTVIRFKTSAGAIVVTLTGQHSQLANEVVSAYEHARAGVPISTPPIASSRNPSASAP